LNAEVFLCTFKIKKNQIRNTWVKEESNVRVRGGGLKTKKDFISGLINEKNDLVKEKTKSIEKILMVFEITEGNESKESLKTFTVLLQHLFLHWFLQRCFFSIAVLCILQ
jgi:hypothetical protein